MFQVARTVSHTLAEIIDVSARGHQKAENKFSATFILGGQIKNSEMALYLIYPEGNFIEVSNEQPFFQIGETKYGRPILVRAFDPDMIFEDAIKLLMVSFDSTIKANLSVGLPWIYRFMSKTVLPKPKHSRLTPEMNIFKWYQENGQPRSRRASQHCRVLNSIIDRSFFMAFPQFGSHLLPLLDSKKR